MKSFTLKQLFLALILPLLVSTHALGMIKNIAGTYQILKDNYKHLSLVHGCIAWETGFVRRQFDAGQIFPVYDVDQNDRQVITRYRDLEHTHMTTRLIHALFYRVPGSTGDADFGISKKLKAKKIEDVAKLSAQLLAAVEVLDMNRTALSEILQSISPAKKDHQEIIQNLSQKPWDLKTYNKVASVPEIRQLSEHEKAVINACKNTITAINKIAQQLFGDFAINQMKPLTLPEILIGSLEECDSRNPDYLFMPHTTHTILLSFVYKACSDNRTALALFYSTLNQQLQQAVLKPDTFLDQAWQDATFAPITQDEALEKIKRIVVNDKDQAKKNLDAHLENFVYCEQQIKSFPSPVGYATARITYNTKMYSFPDCMENSLRNFLNALAYNPKTNQFQLNTLKKNVGIPGDVELHPDVEKFYTIHRYPSKATSLEAHDDWAQLTANIPYVTYIQEATDGIFKYELRPALTTLIIVLNHLLALDLFGQNIDQEVTRPDFVTHYFPLLSKTLGVTTYRFALRQAAQENNGQLAQNLDQLDFGDPIYTTMVFQQDMLCEFMTRRGHGEFRLYSQGAQIEKNLKEVINNSKFLCDSIPSLWLLLSELNNRSYIDTRNPIPDAVIFNLIFTMPLHNANLLEKIIGYYLHPQTSVTRFTALKDLFIRLAQKQPDANQQQLLTMKILRFYVASLSPQQFGEDVIEQAIEIASTNIKHTDPGVSSPAIQLFKALLQKGLAFEQALDIASAIISDNDSQVRSKSLKLFKILFEEKQGIDQALTIASTNISSENENIYQGALDLFKELFEKRYGFAKAFEIASTNLESNKPLIRKNALKLLTELATNEQYLQAAMKAASKNINDSESSIRVEAIKLLYPLLEQEHNIPEIIKVVSERINDEDFLVRKEVLLILGELVGNGYCFDEAINAASTNITGNSPVRSSAFDLFKALFEREERITDVLAAAQSVINKKESGEISLNTFQAKRLQALIDKHRKK